MKHVAVIGVGNMGKILSKAIASHHPDLQISLLTRRPEKITEFAKEIQATIIQDKDKLAMIKEADLIIVCIKPHQFDAYFNQLYDHLERIKPKTWVSIAVGKSLAQLQQLTPAGHRWIRLMPNTPTAVGQGYMAMCHPQDMDADAVQDVRQLFQKSAIVQVFDEAYFNTVSAISGSGPAFMYQLMEAMADAAVKHGLKREQAYQMVGQLLVGSGHMLLESGKHPGQLKDEVTSPGGTTIEGVSSLEKDGFRWAIINAIDQTINKASSLN